MSYWWVNHKQTRNHEVRGGYLWSPLRNANNARNQTYENMALAKMGDVVFSYANGQIGAIGVVTEAANLSPKPSEFGAVGDYWSNEGWLVEVQFQELSTPLRPKDHIMAIGPLLPTRHSPIQKNGDGNQGCYLAAISDVLGLLLVTISGMEEYTRAEIRLRIEEPVYDQGILVDIQAVQQDDSLRETQRVQLAKARVGQGLFRNRVMLLDPTCRVTGVTDARVLIASHIKPWKESSNAERVSGYNGIMLSPHVDALFDSRLITFEDDGRMHVHPSLRTDVLEKWSIDPGRRVERFLPEQAHYLQHHRQLFAAMF
jgi:hypothetical protein